MGLDITAFRKVTLIRAMTVQQANAEDYDPWPRKETLLYLDHPSRTQHDGMAEGAYSYEDEEGFCAGSYHGYNAWRKHLARLVGVRADDVHGGRAVAPAFQELIHFADNEGFMGPKTSAKLAQDFADWRERAVAYAATIDEPEWFVRKYDDWAKAFRFASDGGAVKFH